MKYSLSNRGINPGIFWVFGMSILLMCLLNVSQAQNSNVQDLSPQDIIDEVNNGIDNIDCGLRDVSNQAQNIIQSEIDAVNDRIKNILDQYDLGCLYSMLNVSFSGIFQINLNLPNICEIASDILNKDTAFLQTENGSLLKAELERNIRNKNKFKDNVKNNW